MGVQQHFYVRNPSNITGPNGSLTLQMFDEKVQKRLVSYYTLQLCKAVEGMSFQIQSTIDRSTNFVVERVIKQIYFSG